MNLQPHIALLSAGSLVLFSHLVQAQEPRLLYTKGQHLDAGELVRFDQLEINDSGTIALETSVLRDGLDLILRGTETFLVEGAPLPVPAGTTFVGAYGAMSMNEAGSLGLCIRLGGTVGGKQDDDALTWNNLLLLQEETPTYAGQVGGVPFTSGTPYHSFQAVWLNDADQLLVLGTLDDTTFKGRESYASLLRTDGLGAIVDEEFLAVRRYPLPVGGETVDSVITSRDLWALNDRGDWVGQVQVGTETRILRNGVELLATGDESVARPGRNFVGFTTVDLNNRGDLVFVAILDGSKLDNSSILLNDAEVVVSEGDSFPDIAPYFITRFDAAPVRVADDGAVFWYGATDSSGPARRGYFRSTRSPGGGWTHQALVLSGVTTIGDRSVQDLRTSQFAFDVSDSGRFWIGEVLLHGGEAILGIDLREHR